jgi:hypothetical protein
MNASMPAVGSELFDKNGVKVGTLKDVLFEPRSLQPEWYDVKVGLLGGHHLVPADSVTIVAGYGVVPFGKNVIKSAPGASVPPAEDERRSLMAHYRAAHYRAT